MFTVTGLPTNHLVMPVGFDDPSQPDGVRIVEQLVLTLRTLGDDKEYQCTFPDLQKAPATSQVDQWQRDATVLTCFCTSARAIPFTHDTETKDAQGRPKRYANTGRKVMVGSTQIEMDALVAYTAYDVQPAGSVDLLAAGQTARGAYLAAQAVYKQRSNAARLEKAKASIEAKKKAAKDKVKKSA